MSSRCFYFLQPFHFLPFFFFFFLFFLTPSTHTPCTFFSFAFFLSIPAFFHSFHCLLLMAITSFHLPCYFAFLRGLAVARIPSLYLVWWGKMFLPASSFFGKEEQGVERLRCTCETTVVNHRKSPCLKGQGGLCMASLKWHLAGQKRRKNEKLKEENQEQEDLRTRDFP